MDLTKRAISLVSFFLIFSCKKNMPVIPYTTTPFFEKTICKPHSSGHKSKKMTATKRPPQNSKVIHHNDTNPAPCNNNSEKPGIDSYKSKNQVKSKPAITQTTQAIPIAKKCKKNIKYLDGESTSLSTNTRTKSDDNSGSKKMIPYAIKNPKYTFKKKSGRSTKSKKSISKCETSIKKEKLSKLEFLKSKVEDLKTKYKEAGITSKIAILSILGLGTITTGAALAFFYPLALAGDIIAVIGLIGLVITNAIVLCISQINRSKIEKKLKMLTKIYQK